MRKLAIAVLAAFALGAASQYTYTKSLKRPLTVAEATQGANWFMAVKDSGQKPWTGTLGEMKYCCIRRTPVNADYPDGLATECQGDETVPADMLPEGALGPIRVIN